MLESSRRIAESLQAQVASVHPIAVAGKAVFLKDWKNRLLIRLSRRPRKILACQRAHGQPAADRRTDGERGRNPTPKGRISPEIQLEHYTKF
jgi:hypothetical protein